MSGLIVAISTDDAVMASSGGPARRVDHGVIIEGHGYAVTNDVSVRD